MALLGNYSVLLRTPGRALGGSTVSGERAQWGSTGSKRGRYAGWAGIASWTAFPCGYKPGMALLPATTDGEVGSYNRARGVASSTANLAGGVNATGDAAGSSSSSADLQLVVSATGSTAGSSSTSADLVGVLAGAGSIAGSSTVAGALDAIGWMVGSASGSASSSAALTATGELSGTSSTAAELSPQALASAVWSAAAALYDTPGSMGAKVNAAGGAADPWDDERALTVPKFIALK